MFTVPLVIPSPKPKANKNKLVQVLKQASIRKTSTGLYHEGDTVYASTPACIGSIIAVIIMLLVVVVQLQTLANVKGLNVYEDDLETF